MEKIYTYVVVQQTMFNANGKKTFFKPKLCETTSMFRNVFKLDWKNYFVKS